MAGREWQVITYRLDKKNTTEEGNTTTLTKYQEARSTRLNGIDLIMP
jgi:hypothetical protein